MRIVGTCLIAGMALTPLAAYAQMSDAAYCQALSAKYRDVTGGTQNNQAVAEAMDQCGKGNTAAGIPTLEKALKDQKATLPARN
ncbi:hypothetical protein SAMN02990966_00273 [Rhodospirillales bacterium URHD0017]|nr:hypothetical protein SAMN02990966_00273 [Rhodospirillales bacterium URHD0017]